jgi:hypothetical protein
MSNWLGWIIGGTSSAGKETWLFHAGHRDPAIPAEAKRGEKRGELTCLVASLGFPSRFSKSGSSAFQEENRA